MGELIDFMPVDDRRQGTHRQRLIRRVLCVKGSLHFNAEVEPRFDYGRATADIAVTDGGAVFATPDLTLSLSAPVAFERTQAGVRAGFALDHGQSATFVLEHGEQPRPVLGGRHARAVQRDGRLLAALDRRGALPGSLAGDRPALRADAQAPDLPAVRRDHRRRDNQPARAARRGAQLGLPLHVDSRRRVLPLRAVAARIHRGGRGVRRLADRPLPRGAQGRVRAAPDHVRDRRQLRSRGADPRPPGGLLRLRSGADRQRRSRPAAARHLRRAGRLHLPLQQVRNADLPRRVDGSDAHRRLGLGELGPA